MKQDKPLNLSDPLYFYGGTETLRFDKEDWQWYRVCADGQLQKLNGVTRISGILDKSVYLMPWACKMMALKILNTVPMIDGTVGDCAWERFEELVNNAKTAHKEELVGAADIGKKAHEWIEASIVNAITFNGGIVKEMASLLPEDPRAVKCGEAAFEWMVAHDVRWLCTEKVVYSRKYGYAGTTDGLARVSSCDNPACCPRLFLDELSIIDWKSSNHLSLSYLFQTAAYQQAEQEESGEEIASRWICRLPKDEDGKPEFWHEYDFAMDWAAFEACMTLHRLNKLVEKRMSEAKKLRTFRRREAKKSAKMKK